MLSQVRQVVFLRGAEPVRTCVCGKADWHKDNVVLHLEGLDDFNAVQPLIGCEVAVRREDIPALPEGQYYWHQLKGLTALDRRFGTIGLLDDMFTTAAHDIYVVVGSYGEVLIPAVEVFLVEVDLEKQCVLFDLPEGLVQEN